MGVGRRRVVYAGKNIILEYEPVMEHFAEIAMGDELAEACRDVVENEALPYAISISPSDDGEYARSWRITEGTWTSPQTRLTRRCVNLVNVAAHSYLVEWGGTKPQYKARGQHVLQRTRDHISTGIDKDIA
jgi:hypothetical protein